MVTSPRPSALKSKAPHLDPLSGSPVRESANETNDRKKAANESKNVRTADQKDDAAMAGDASLYESYA